MKFCYSLPLDKIDANYQAIGALLHMSKDISLKRISGYTDKEVGISNDSYKNPQVCIMALCTPEITCLCDMGRKYAEHCANIYAR